MGVFKLINNREPLIYNNLQKYRILTNLKNYQAGIYKFTVK